MSMGQQSTGSSAFTWLVLTPLLIPGLSTRYGSKQLEVQQLHVFFIVFVFGEGIPNLYCQIYGHFE